MLIVLLVASKSLIYWNGCVYTAQLLCLMLIGLDITSKSRLFISEFSGHHCMCSDFCQGPNSAYCKRSNGFQNRLFQTCVFLKLFQILALTEDTDKIQTHCNDSILFFLG